MKKYNFKDMPLEIYGVPFWKQTGQLRRLPDSVIDKVPRLEFLGKRCPGARVCFRTDAEEFTVRITFETLTFDVGMSIYACQSAAVLIGERENAHFAGLVNPPDYNTFTFEKTIHKEKGMEDVTIFLPRNEIIANVEIIVPKEAKVESPTPYRALKPILYYGSSITEGGCCCSVFNAYNAILSNRLNVDYFNPALSLAKIVKENIIEKPNLNQGKTIFYASKDPNNFALSAKTFFDVDKVELIDIT